MKLSLPLRPALLAGVVCTLLAFVQPADARSEKAKRPPTRPASAAAAAAGAAAAKAEDVCARVVCLVSPEAAAGDAAAGGAEPQKTGGHRGGHSGHVSPPSSPTKVKVGVYLIGIAKIDPPSEAFPTFTAEVFLDLQWHDPRLAFDAEAAGTAKEVFQGRHAEELLAEIWWPEPTIENQQEPRVTEAKELIILSDGTVEYAERFKAVLHEEVDLRRFPFDSQWFEIDLESFVWDERGVVFEPWAEKTGYNANHHVLEWHIIDVEKQVRSQQEIRSPHPFSQLIFRVKAERDPGFYLWKILAPLLIIVIFTWSAFWMTGEPATSRLERSFISLLTVVAFHQIVASNLPRISYLTFMDAVVFVAFAFVGLTMAHVMFIHRLERREELVRAERLDRIARATYPLLFVVVLTGLWIFYHR